MKIVISCFLFLLTSGVAWAQAGFTSIGSIFGITQTLESKLEPPTPAMNFTGAMGQKFLPGKKGFSRYLVNNTTHEYFGYDMKIEPVDRRADTCRLTFSALSLKPADLSLPDDGSWRMLPPPIFPAPQIVSTSDTIAFDLLEIPATGQKVVDYIRLRRDNCDAESAGPNQISCFNNLVNDARQSLANELAKMEGTQDPAIVVSLKSSEQAWETYRDQACAGLSTEVKRLQCELKLTRSHTHDLGTIY
ncbi:MAG TPA: lysozyme inhibitor LprI family protein [Bryobacteraceae bacterium]|jgi:uncharacterized protein YecT (DUF1311 family)|nr:lysozyme inhibitor LprI family protein [Bryobacteraceae bacterium]